MFNVVLSFNIPHIVDQNDVCDTSEQDREAEIVLNPRTQASNSYIEPTSVIEIKDTIFQQINIQGQPIYCLNG